MFLQDDLDWIWQTYKCVRRGDLVIRSGFGLCGIYSYEKGEGFDYHHPESDSEHANGCIEIARNISRAFPKLFTTEEWQRIYDLLKYHDLGEIDYGDHPDDGTQNVEEKNAVEIDAFEKSIAYLPPEDANILLRDFQSFQMLDLGLVIDEEHYKLASFAKLCDKLDAVLRAILYELNGAGGDLAYKELYHPPLSERDAFYVSFTGTTKIAPNWALHFMDICHKYPYFAIFFAILRPAVQDINNGVFYSWFKKAQRNFNIATEKLYYCQI